MMHLLRFEDGSFVGSPTNTSTTNRELAASWTKRAEAEGAARIIARSMQRPVTVVPYEREILRPVTRPSADESVPNCGYLTDPGPARVIVHEPTSPVSDEQPYVVTSVCCGGVTGRRVTTLRKNGVEQRFATRALAEEVAKACNEAMSKPGTLPPGVTVIYSAARK